MTFGAVNVTTDATGFFSEATYPDDDRLVQRGANAGYEDIFVPTTVITGIPSISSLKLTPIGTSGAVTGTTGGAVSATTGPARLTFPANSLVDSAGTPSGSSVSVRVTSLEVGGDAYLLSGDYTSSTIAPEPLEAFGAVVLTNADNREIAAATPAVVRIPVSTRTGTPPSSANLYYLDPATARWVQEGTASLVVNDPAGAYYEGTVARFAQWMVGQALQSPVTVQGCVEDDAGAPVANARIVAEGISYSGLGYATTNTSGQFTIPVKAGSNLLVTGRRGAVLTNALSVSTTTSNVVLPTCLTLPSSNAATVRLTWGSNPRDIDSHLHVPGGAHVYYVSQGSLTIEPFASLDVDDVTSFGPEITTIRRPKVGIYRFYLHNFSRTFNPGMTQSPTRVELNYLGRTVAFSPPTGEGTSLYWHLFDIEVGANCSMTLYRYNRFRADEPANPNAAGTAQFCTPS